MPGKGTLAASDRLVQFLRQITSNGRRPAWALKLDVASFFPSIRKQSLFEIIARRIDDAEILWLTRTILLEPTRIMKPSWIIVSIRRFTSAFGRDSRRDSAMNTLPTHYSITSRPRVTAMTMPAASSRITSSG